VNVQGVFGSRSGGRVSRVIIRWDFGGVDPLRKDFVIGTASVRLDGVGTVLPCCKEGFVGVCGDLSKSYQGTKK
jgi:hypothetical protein